MRPNKQTLNDVDDNAPFELLPETPSRYGVLLIHGLLDAPFAMKDMGLVLQKAGFWVRAILLPGHGAQPSALLDVVYEDWLQAVRYGVASFPSSIEGIFLIGQSTGGTLALLTAMQESARIQGLVLLSPAFKINSMFDFLSGKLASLHSVWPRMAWFQQTLETDYVKYQSLCYNAIYQVYRLGREIKKQSLTSPYQGPAFYAFSWSDMTVKAQATMAYFKQYASPQSRMVLYAPKPHIFDDPRIECRPSTYPDLNIIDFSHFALPISPLNPHYGNKNNPMVRWGEYNYYHLKLNQILYALKIAKYHDERLSFNPDFEYLTTSIITFLQQQL